MIDPRYKQGYRFDEDCSPYSDPENNREYNEKAYWRRYYTLLYRWSTLIAISLMFAAAVLEQNNFMAFTLSAVGVVALYAVLLLLAALAINYILLDLVFGIIGLVVWMYRWLLAKE